MHGFSFVVVEGMILLGGEAGHRRMLDEARKDGRFRTAWEWERWANHQHQTMSLPPQVLVLREMEYAVELMEALRDAFPDREFVVTHIPGYAVSFYQRTPDASEKALSEITPPNPTEFCQTCEAWHSYVSVPKPGPQFPDILWGKCLVCGSYVLAGDHELRTIVSSKVRGN